MRSPRAATPAQATPHLAVLEASPNAIIAVDAQARIAYANARAEASFGYTRDELFGQLVELLLPGRIAERHVGHRDGFLAHPVARPMGIGLELAGRRKDGSEFPIEISLAPVETAEGTQVFATVVDITARIRARRTAESALAESESRFRAVLEASPDAIIAVDTQGSITYVNPQTENSFGYTRGELLGQAVERLLPESVADGHVAHRNGFMTQPISRPVGIGLDLAGRRKDGSEFPVEISLSPVTTAEGLQVFATVVDITARKSAESQLLQAQKLESIGRLAGGIAHDFNNMLFAISGYAEMLAQDLSPDAARDFDRAAALRSVEAITQATERATVLTSQLLAFGRRRLVNPLVLDLNDRIVAIEPMLRPLIGEQIHLELDLDPDIGHIQADPGQLDQILVNLVVNARDAMPEGGTVTIETGSALFDELNANEAFEVPAGRYVLMAVTDTGLGMDPITRDHIFEPFFTTKELGKGTGLGLATIYGIVRQAGGHIRLDTELGQGSTFMLYFPRDDTELAAEVLASNAVPTTASGSILVVEDDPAVREMTTALLERAGYDVMVVGDGSEALAAADRLDGRIDVLVTDVAMPGISGIEVGQRMLERSPKVGVVLLSGYTGETLELARMTTQGAIFIGKPVTSAQLLAAIARAMPDREAVVS
jgi:PAS domain S-box-containing protein